MEIGTQINNQNICIFGKYLLDNNGSIKAKTNFNGYTQLLPEDIGDTFSINNGINDVNKAFFFSSLTGEWTGTNMYYSICGASSWQLITSGYHLIFIR